MKKRGKVVDMLLLLGTALLVAGLSTGAALVSEAYHISPAWLLAFFLGFMTAIWLFGPTGQGPNLAERSQPPRKR